MDTKKELLEAIESNSPEIQNGLHPWEINTLINFFLYTMSQEQRRDLARRLPHIYNIICRKEMCKVVHADDKKEW